MNRDRLINLVLALGIGASLWFVFGLRPVWWLTWILPGLLLWLALRTEGWNSRGLVFVAALIGESCNLGYFLAVMPPPPAILVLLLQALMWTFIIGSARRVIKTYESGWTVFALPVIGVAMDTLLAHLTPDGNWGSLAYTQADLLPVAQTASVFGVGGILFLLLWVNSALALGLTYGLRLRGAWLVFRLPALALALAVGFGWWRLHAAVDGKPMAVGIVAVDDYVNGPRSQNSDKVWAQYAAQVPVLAARGAKFVLLPEKIDVLASADAEARKAQLAALARDNHVWLVAGLGVDDGKTRRNEAWWYAPDGRLVTNYLKHFMAPPEREFVSGSEYPVNDIDGVRYGVAICKDMHFASLGRGFGARGAAVMLVPAWDFNDDAWMAANMTKLRGVENGFAVVRSARNGLLSISDAYGRMLVVERSASLPGATLFGNVPTGEPLATIYTRIGDLLGWLCVAAALLMVPLSFRKRKTGSVIS